MSREIKFRAWDSECEHMLSWGDLTSLHCDGLTLIQEIHRKECDYLELMQYTGLKDKNGVDIYEGDILSHPKQGNRKVIYPMSDNFAGFGLVDICGRKNTLQDSRAIYEVIGNIHQNPELLGE